MSYVNTDISCRCVFLGISEKFCSVFGLEEVLGQEKHRLDYAQFFSFLFRDFKDLVQFFVGVGGHV